MRKKPKLTITKNKDNTIWYYEYFINLNGKYAGFIGKIFKHSDYLNVCSCDLGINSTYGDFKTIKEVRNYIQNILDN